MACETPGIIAEVLKAQRISLDFAHAFEGQPVPKDLARADGLVAMGAMGVSEQSGYPFLSPMKLIERAVHAEKPVFGVCLGSQLLAAMRGATVKKDKQEEIG